jgi:hypothetical protein
MCGTARELSMGEEDSPLQSYSRVHAVDSLALQPLPRKDEARTSESPCLLAEMTLRNACSGCRWVTGTVARVSCGQAVLRRYLPDLIPLLV